MLSSVLCLRNCNLFTKYPVKKQSALLMLLCAFGAHAQMPAPPTNLTIGDNQFPDSTNTGIPAGITLTPSGSISVSVPGTVIDAKNVSGTITINASNVTVKRSRVRGSGYHMIQIKDGLSNVRIEDCEIDGSGTAAGSNGIYGPVTAMRNEVYGVENGIVPSSGSVVQSNYIHGLRAPGSPHYDGIQIDGARSNISVVQNTIDMTEHTQTATVMIDNYFGPISNITVDGNLLRGAGYTVYSDGQFSGGAITGVKYTNNRIAKGSWGYLYPGSRVDVWSGNLDDKTEQVIPR